MAFNYNVAPLKSGYMITSILGFLISQAVTAVIRFFYGSTNKSQEDTAKQMKDMQGGGK